MIEQLLRKLLKYNNEKFLEKLDATLESICLMQKKAVKEK